MTTSTAVLSSNKGQALVETVVMLAITLVCATALGNLYWTQWQRFRCAHDVFETTHWALVHEDLHRFRIEPFERNVRIQNRSDRVIGEKSCGHLHEKVEFTKLPYLAPEYLSGF